MKRALPLTLAIALHLPAHAADALPASLTGVWGTAESLHSGTAAQNFVHLDADGFGFAVGSGGVTMRMRQLAQAAQPAKAASAAVHTQAEFEAAIASGHPTPLDVLTPYGKHRLVRSIIWGRKGMSGFSFVPLVRELDAGQIEPILRFLDLTDYRAMLVNRMRGAPLRLPAPSADVAMRLESLEDFDRQTTRQQENAASTTLGAAAVLQRYQQTFADHMGPDVLKRQPLGDLLPLFDAAALADFQNPGSTAFDQMLLVHAELTARGIDTRRMLDESVLDAMLRARRFAQARGFATAHPHLDANAIPHIADPLPPGFKGRSVYRYDAPRNTLTRQAVPLPSVAELVMVVSAGCHFSHDALEAIGKDDALQERLRAANLLLVTPPNEAPALRFVGNWNAEHPALPMRIPFDAHEWQAIDVSGVPAFYLLKDGKVVAQHRGWAGEEDRLALLRLLDAAAR